MALIKRTPRLLAREQKPLRDDRLFFIACDDRYAPKQYFDSFNLTRVRVEVIPTLDGSSSAPHVLERLMDCGYEDGDERWMLLDIDHCLQSSHIATFTNSIKEAKDKGVKVALSMPCFELWLLLHHLDARDVEELKTAKQTELKLRSVLGSYNKTRLNMGNFTLSHVKNACERADKLDQSEIPTSPASQVHNLIKAIVAKALLSQLPEELHSLRN